MCLLAILFVLFQVAKWILKHRTRRIISLAIIGLIGALLLINKLFFQQMELLQSKVYPNLYLIKYPVNNRDTINQLIKNKTVEVIKQQNYDTNSSIKLIDKNTVETIRANDYTIHFYLYSNEWGFRNGTNYFIDHKEDAGGFSTEVLTDYNTLKLAYFELKYCENNSTHVIGDLSYFEEGKLITTETLINNCHK